MEQLKAHLTQLNKFEWQRKGWLVFSAFVTAVIAGIILNWDYLIANHIMWVIASFGLLLAMAWWYWSMRLIRFVLRYKIAESEILNQIMFEIRDIKKTVLADLTKSK